MKDQFNNFIEEVKEYIRKKFFIFAPIFMLVIYIVSSKLKIITILVDSNLQNNVVNVSGVLSGFLFTAYGIFISLPDNKFISILKNVGYFTVIYKTLLFGIIFLLSSMLMGMFNVLDKVMILSFLLGISEFILSVYYFYKITTLSARSK